MTTPTKLEIEHALEVLEAAYWTPDSVDAIWEQRLIDARDAEAYRWLLENALTTDSFWPAKWSMVIHGPSPGANAPPEAIRAAIEAARKDQNT